MKKIDVDYRKQKIILILTNDIWGLNSFRKEVVKAICEAEYKVIISTPEENQKADFFKDIGCHIVLTKLNRRGLNPMSDLRLLLEYRTLIKRLKPRAILTYTIKPNIYGGVAARLSNVPQLANITGLGDAIENGGWLQKLAICLYKIGLTNARRVFFQNASNRTFCIHAGIADSSSILLPGSGVNLDYHKYQDYPKDVGVVRFLYIGRLLKDKGIEELFEAAAIIHAEYPNTEFQVIGGMDNDYKSQLEVLVAKKVINYLGPKTDVRPFIGNVECTIMPSYHEGMSNVNLESAANGRPVITTNVPGCRETVEDGITGYLIEAKNTKSLIAAIEKFMSLPYDQKVIMGKAARRKVEAEFDRKIVVAAYLKELDELSHV